MALDSGYWESAKDTNVLTNADRIRAMSDEELAYFLSDREYDCSEYQDCGECPRITVDGCMSILWYLQQPVKEET